MEPLERLLEKLKAAKFTGELHLRFEAGEVASAKLEHFLPISEIERVLPTIEPEPSVGTGTKFTRIQAHQ
jgi:hypothetical protein